MAGPECTDKACKYKIEVWSRENYCSSLEAQRAGEVKGKAVEVEITLPVGQTGFCNEYVCIGSSEKLADLLSCDPFEKDGRTRNPCFSHRFAYYMLNRFIGYLNGKLDIDVSDVRAILKRKIPPVLTIAVNFPGLSNAFYEHRINSLIFGDFGGRLPTATDGDVVVHEATHWVLDLINPLLVRGFFGAGRSIDEGCADAIAALLFDNPQIAEDMRAAEHGAGSGKGLRTVKNSETLRSKFGVEWVDMDPHNIGEVISGFFWSLAERFTRLLRKKNPKAYEEDPAAFRERARNATMKLIFVHIGSYNVASPDFADFPQAVTDAAESLYDTDKSLNLLSELTEYGVDIETIKGQIREEAGAREFDWYAEKFGKQGQGAIAISQIPFSDEPVEIGAGKGGALFYQQLYETKSHGKIPVLSHGMVVRADRAGIRQRHAEGVLRIKEGLIEDRAKIGRGGAYMLARSNIEQHLKQRLSRTRSGDLTPGDIQWLVERTSRELRKHGPTAGRLAIFPKRMAKEDGDKTAAAFEPLLVWHFEMDSVSIAIDANTGDLVAINIHAR